MTTVRRLAIALLLGALCGFVLAGVGIVSFHGDEPMQIFMSNDYVALLIDRDPEYLKVAPPYPIDSAAHLRLINGSVNRYLIGLSWHLAGYTSGDLPRPPGWDWGISYEDNATSARRPDDAFMVVARASSAVLTTLGVLLMYAIGRAAGGLYAGLIAAMVYALHPVVLINGRRAMQEGSMLAFGLLAVAAACAWALLPDRAQAWRRIAIALLLALAAALAIASKHTAAVFVIGAYAIVGVDILLRRAGWRRRVGSIGLAALSAGLAFALWIMLSPALWNDPIARIGDLLSERARLLEIQVMVDPAAPMPTDERIAAIVTQPFIAPMQQFEVGWWLESATARAEVQAYAESPLRGIEWGAIGGGALTLLAWSGAGLALVRGWRRRGEGRGRLAIGLAAWAALVALSLLVNPLPWQRYYLPLIPPLILLVGYAVAWAGARASASR
jgi:4-amino-4-deoxy-L-arabinose transferase-like glycosyltransferase